MDQMRDAVVAWLGTTDANALTYVQYTCLTNLANSIMVTGVLVIYINLVSGRSAQAVGYSEGVFGMFALLPGALSGYASDLGYREEVLRAAGTCIVGASAAFFVQLFVWTTGWPGFARAALERATSLGSFHLLLLCATVSLLYGGQAMADATAKAVAANSTPGGAFRLAFFSKTLILSKVAQATGPLLSLAAFALGSDVWGERECGGVLMMGLLVKAAAGFCCFRFAPRSERGGRHHHHRRRSSTLSQRRSRSSHSRSSSAGGGAEPSSREQLRFVVPFLYLLSDLVWNAGSGMSVKFFPVYFEESRESGGLGLAPTAVMAVAAAVPLLCVAVTTAALRAAQATSRVRVDLVMWYVGVAFLVGIIVLGPRGSPTAVVLLYLSRTALLSSTAAIQQSIVMDYAPRDTRARWASLDTLSNVGWSGSAAIGGTLIHQHGYIYVFACTAALHLASTLFKLPLLCLLPSSDKEPASLPDSDTEGCCGAAGGEHDECSDESRPLLASSRCSRTSSSGVSLTQGVAAPLVVVTTFGALYHNE